MKGIPEKPFALEKKGFRIEEQATTDSVRWVWCIKTYEHVEPGLNVETYYEMDAVIEYELCILDDPCATVRDNHNYQFNRIYFDLYKVCDDYEDEEKDIRKRSLLARISVSPTSLADMEKMISKMDFYRKTDAPDAET